MFSNIEQSKIDKIKGIINGSFKVNFISIILSCKHFNIHGNGYVYQNRAKELIVVFFRKEQLSQEKIIQSIFSEGKGGVKDSICKLNATDAEGKVYTSTVFLESDEISNIKEFKIYNLNSTIDGASNRLIVCGDYKLPANSRFTAISTMDCYDYNEEADEANPKNRKVNLSLTGKHSILSKEKWKIELENKEIHIGIFDGYLDIVIYTSAEIINDLDLKKIIQTLDFVLGEQLEVVYHSIKGLGSQINSKDKMFSSKPRLSLPLPLGGETRNGTYQTRLFIKYYEYINSIDINDFNLLLEIHRKIVADSRMFSENFGATLAIQIEALVKKFFNKLWRPDKDKKSIKEAGEFKKEAGQLLKYLEENITNKNLKNIISERLNRLIETEQANSSKTIKWLIREKMINGKFHSWKKLRNGFAHGKVEDTTHKELIELLYDCEEMYYTMIFYLIGYEGKYYISQIGDYCKLKEYKLPQKEV